MPNWTKSMIQTYEYYVVDPGTWMDSAQIDTVTRSTINRDASAETLGSATIDMTGEIDECYIRIYLVTIQNGVEEKFALGTYLVQTPSFTFDGKTTNRTLDAYTPLIELKENPPDFGYTVMKGNNIMDIAGRLTEDHTRAPVITTTSTKNMYTNFVADANDTWLSYIKALIENARYEFAINPLGEILFAPIRNFSALRHVWEYNDSNSSILYPEIVYEEDLYAIPNVVEVVYSSNEHVYTARVVNKSRDSVVSTVNRGREILYRDVSPSFAGVPSKAEVQEYAENLLETLSSVQCTLTYTHGYCPVKLKDCVLLNYERAGLKNIKAQVIKQSISCTPGCPVEETAVYTKNLWR